MAWARSVVALASIALLAIVAALPWGLPAEDRFFLPLLPAVAIYFWALRDPEVVPEWLVFLVGLALDILTNGPLGYWALIYLMAQFIAGFTIFGAARGMLVRAGTLMTFLLGVTLVAWCVSSIYFLEFSDWRPYVTGALLAGVSAVPLLPVFYLLDGFGGASERGNLLRGL